jgi:hypothetical protein
MKSHTLDAYVAIGITLFFATVALILRFISKRMTKFGYGYEDCLATLAWARLPFLLLPTYLRVIVRTSF